MTSSSYLTFRRLGWLQLSVLAIVTGYFFGILWFGSFQNLKEKFFLCSHELNLLNTTDCTHLLKSTCDECKCKTVASANDWKEESLLHLSYMSKDSRTTTAKDIFQYLKWTNSSSCRFAVDFGFSLHGSGDSALPDGHKAVCLDSPFGPVYNRCLVYSFGINNAWSFDEAMAKFKCKVYAFDPSMGVPDHNRSDYIQFFNLGLSSENKIEERYGKPNKTKNYWKMMKASSIYDTLKASHGDRPIDVFKMDIESSEWTVLEEMLYSGFLASRVKQLAVEIHFSPGAPLDVYQDHIGLLKNIESPLGSGEDSRKGGFARFSSRYNPFTKRHVTILGGEEDYGCYEMAWYNQRFL